MTNAQMRLEVAAMYPSANWHRRVSKMPDNQIYAIYRTKMKREQQLQEVKETNNDYHQIDIWEYLMERDL